MKNILSIALISLTILASCQSKKNQNIIFEKSDPASKAYKDELASKIKANAENLTYTLNRYKEANGQEFLDVDIEGSDFNAVATILVNNWSKFERIKETKGIGYSGAELKGLKLSIEENAEGAILKYRDVKEVID